MARRDDGRREDPLAAIGAACVILLTFGALVWLVASHRIVHATLAPALSAASLWKWIPCDYCYTQWNETVLAVRAIVANPGETGLLQWVELVNMAFRPAAVLLAALYVAAVVWLARRHRSFARRFTADGLMQHALQHFSGIAPVIAIRRRIARNEHPLWRRQVAPEEVFQRYKVPANVRSSAPVGTPMVGPGGFDLEVARTYFTALAAAPESSGRWRSTMLGRQVVDLVADRAGAMPVFADRLSDEGKALLALWSAVAFGGEAGREEFRRYRDMLNRSAYGTRDGLANLSLAQPLFERYRTHPLLARAFAIHHWEHTLLFFLLGQAQRKGRFTTAEVIWLRPTNRIMYFALNSRGSGTPHTEAAATFAQFAFETACARQGRLPLERGADGRLRHVIHVERAVEALAQEYAEWAAAAEDDDDWWMRADLWRRGADAAGASSGAARQQTESRAGGGIG